MICAVTSLLAIFSTISQTSGEFAASRFLAAASGSPIDGSESWVSCFHKGMSTCDGKCCCNEGLEYLADEIACVTPFDPIQGSDSWVSCWHPGMYTCHHKCCCYDGFKYDTWKIACVKQSDADMPGFQFLGFGYDVLVGNPLFTTGDGDEGVRTNIFAFSHEGGSRTPDGKWKIPDKTTSQVLSACSTEQNVNTINSIYAYQHTIGASFDLDFSAFGAAFTFGVDAQKVRSNTYKNDYVYATVHSTCAVYDLTMHMSDAASLDPNFVKGVSDLPADYDEDAYMFFIQQFGTHVIIRMTLGGRWGWQLQFESNSYQNLLDESVNINAGIQMGASAKMGISVTPSKDDTTTAVMNAIYKNSSFNVGGDFHVDVKAWEESVRSKPMPVKMSLFNLYDLFTDAYMPGAVDLEKKRNNMKNASSQYCPYRKNQVHNGSCVPPVKKPDPMPTPVDPNAIRRICVRNSGAYALWFETAASGGNVFEMNRESFNHGETRCVDGMQLGLEPWAVLKHNQTLHCKVHIIAGNTRDCVGGDYLFDARSHMQATYNCDGSTFTGECKFTGLSVIG